MTIQEAYDKGQIAIEAAKRAAQLMLEQAKHESWEAWQAAYADFVQKHGCITNETVKDIKHHGDRWSMMRTYTAKDGANFFDAKLFPSTKYGVRVEYWVDDAKSVITYV